MTDWMAVKLLGNWQNLLETCPLGCWGQLFTGRCHTSEFTAKLPEEHSWSLGPAGAGGCRGRSLWESDVGQTMHCLSLEK